MMKTFTAYIEIDPETRLYVGIVPGVPGAHSQGATLDELQHNLKEVLELCVGGTVGRLRFPTTPAETSPALSYVKSSGKSK